MDVLMDESTRQQIAVLFDIYEPEGALIWLFSPHGLLGDRVPARAILDGDAHEVAALIDQLASGAFL